MTRQDPVPFALTRRASWRALVTVLVVVCRAWPLLRHHEPMCSLRASHRLLQLLYYHCLLVRPGISAVDVTVTLPMLRSLRLPTLPLQQWFHAPPATKCSRSASRLPARACPCQCTVPCHGSSLAFPSPGNIARHCTLFQCDDRRYTHSLRFCCCCSLCIRIALAIGLTAVALAANTTSSTTNSPAPSLRRLMTGPIAFAYALPRDGVGLGTQWRRVRAPGWHDRFCGADG
ncbi:hypothetical protein BCR44DRAFT_173728 [Catenaria anguillulae PL171]|uniref:Uncharacterized protein n=1 Tax=Catenaria anguillulae PL171 TaxID=765915 RepID=A0A1Y2HYF0_9FUNG|nr:hypothetical protein BCR44DRAFT_173728 [Catenaria anguillulae PL171]